MEQFGHRHGETQSQRGNMAPYGLRIIASAWILSLDYWLPITTRGEPLYGASGPGRDAALHGTAHAGCPHAEGEAWAQVVDGRSSGAIGKTTNLTNMSCRATWLTAMRTRREAVD